MDRRRNGGCHYSREANLRVSRKTNLKSNSLAPINANARSIAGKSAMKI
jgi:hypothetical protein